MLFFVVTTWAWTSVRGNAVLSSQPLLAVCWPACFIAVPCLTHHQLDEAFIPSIPLSYPPVPLKVMVQMSNMHLFSVLSRSLYLDTHWLIVVTSASAQIHVVVGSLLLKLMIRCKLTVSSRNAVRTLLKLTKRKQWFIDWILSFSHG